MLRRSKTFPRPRSFQPLAQRVHEFAYTSSPPLRKLDVRRPLCGHERDIYLSTLEQTGHDRLPSFDRPRLFLQDRCGSCELRLGRAGGSGTQPPRLSCSARSRLSGVSEDRWAESSAGSCESPSTREPPLSTMRPWAGPPPRVLARRSLVASLDFFGCLPALGSSTVSPIGERASPCPRRRGAVRHGELPVETLDRWYALGTPE